MSRNPTVQVALADIRTAEALVKESRSTWLPTLNANGVYTRLDAERPNPAGRGAALLPRDGIFVNGVLNVPLVSPRSWVATAHANRNVDVANLTAKDVKRQLALAAGRAYLTVVLQRHAMTTAERARDTAQALEDYARTRFKGGSGNRLDLTRASQSLESAELRITAARTALLRAREALGVVLGESAAFDAADEPATEQAPPTMAQALGEVGTRSDVVAAQERTEAAKRVSEDSWADYLPLLSANGQVFSQNPATPTLPASGWQAQLVLTLPLYDGGLRYGLKEERDAAYAAAQARLEGTLRQAGSDVRAAFGAVVEADRGVAHALAAQKLAREVLDLANLSYKAGATTNIELVDAESRLADADSALDNVEDTARQARLELLWATGRFP